MKLEGYKAGKYIRVENYRAYILSGINYDWNSEDPELNKLAAEASREVGELNGYSLLVPNINVYLKMLIRIEANKSSKIDGISIDLEEDMLDEENVLEENIENWKKTKQYIEAIKYGIDSISKGEKVHTDIMKEIHKILAIEEAQKKYSGKIRNTQNWINGTTPLDAEYIPPPYTELADCLSDFEKFVDNDNTNTPDIVKLAMLHYQFETIHPFIGENGKIGRIIIPLYLQSKGMLDKSCLYVSEYLEKNKDKYFNELMNVRNSSDIIRWIKFFLQAVIETAKITKNRLKRLVELKKEMDRVSIILPVKPDNAIKVIEVLYEEPIIDRLRLGELADVKPGTMRTIINSLVEKEVVSLTKGNEKGKILIFKKYMDIFLNE